MPEGGSRSLAERCTEHFGDAESISKKSYMIKHWMVSHGEMDTMPPFGIKILKKYRDFLSRQVEEAIHILLSKDQLLNSKNKYIQNCIARITVQEDRFEIEVRHGWEPKTDSAEKENKRGEVKTAGIPGE